MLCWITRGPRPLAALRGGAQLSSGPGAAIIFCCAAAPRLGAARTRPCMPSGPTGCSRPEGVVRRLAQRLGAGELVVAPPDCPPRGYGRVASSPDHCTSLVGRRCPTATWSAASSPRSSCRRPRASPPRELLRHAVVVDQHSALV